ncbi:hypothetical protein OG547_15800 [Streptomyces longwoodensis]|uniref:hypothetical protein n=1 Tax=Streptomyces longwoodensis TaxID=68231 RepID=UPI002ED129F3|nr:hypothetical protein OG547_15800 [Streptomyces longwoodensis]
MPIDVITVLVTSLIQAMATEAWETLRPRVITALGGTQAERANISSTLDTCAANVQRGGRLRAKDDLTALLRRYANTHPDAADVFQDLADELRESNAAINDRSTRMGNVSHSNVATNGAQQANGRGHIHNGDIDNSRSSTRNGAGAVLLMGLAGIAALVLLFWGIPRVKDMVTDSIDGKTTVRTCGEWLRLPEADLGPVARDIALREGNREAARDAFIVQNTQYSCGGVEDRLLADVLSPTGS